MGSFRIRSDFVLSDPQALLGEIQRLQQDVETILDLECSGRPVELLVFRNRQNYRRHVSQRLRHGAERPALYVNGPESSWVYVYDQPDFPIHLRHECTHALLHNALPFLPLWLDEGLAEYFEVARDRRVLQHSHLRSLRWALFFGWRPKLQGLEAKKSLKHMNGRDYRDSWAWVHFFLHGPPVIRERFTSYLEAIQSGRAPGRMSRWLGPNLDDAHGLLVRHFREGPETWVRISDPQNTASRRGG